MEMPGLMDFTLNDSPEDLFKVAAHYKRLYQAEHTNVNTFHRYVNEIGARLQKVEKDVNIRCDLLAQRLEHVEQKMSRVDQLIDEVRGRTDEWFAQMSKKIDEEKPSPRRRKKSRKKKAKSVKKKKKVKKKSVR